MSLSCWVVLAEEPTGTATVFAHLNEADARRCAAGMAGQADYQGIDLAVSVQRVVLADLKTRMAAANKVIDVLKRRKHMWPQDIAPEIEDEIRLELAGAVL